jgi:uncharacterized protein (DUF1778 family)
MRAVTPIRLSDEEKERLESAAALRNLRLASYIRTAALEMAELDTAEERRRQMEAKAREKLVKTMKPDFAEPEVPVSRGRASSKPPRSAKSCPHEVRGSYCYVCNVRV